MRSAGRVWGRETETRTRDAERGLMSIDGTKGPGPPAAMPSSYSFVCLCVCVGGGGGGGRCCLLFGQLSAPASGLAFARGHLFVRRSAASEGAALTFDAYTPALVHAFTTSFGAPGVYTEQHTANKVLVVCPASALTRHPPPPPQQTLPGISTAPPIAEPHFWPRPLLLLCVRVCVIVPCCCHCMWLLWFTFADAGRRVLLGRRFADHCRLRHTVLLVGLVCWCCRRWQRGAD